MCAIVGSFDKDKLIELVKLNSYRGQHSYSISEYDVEEQKLRLLRKEFGEFNLNGIELTEGCYYIAHTQAPTTEAKAHNNIHPSVEADECMLWHNGIIKQDCVNWLQEEVKMPNEKWDTKLLHEYLRYGKDLSEINGTFSCLWYNLGKLYLFRNEISPMFMDEHRNISSTKFENSWSVEANRMWSMVFEEEAMNIGDREVVLKQEYKFTTKENPYFLG